MPAQLEIDELNNVSVRSHAVVNLNVGSVDAPNIVVGPLVALKANRNAYTKYNQLHFVDMGGATTISNIRIWISAGELLPTEVIQTNLSTAPITYVSPTYSVPDTSRLSFNELRMPTSEPVSANLGIGGSLTGTLTAPGYSDLWVWQVQIGSQVPVGALRTKRFTFAWDEDVV